MKQKKLGFTLTELLVSMAIIGIVAATITPMVTKQMQKNETGVLLSKAITQVEVGCQNMIQLANTNATGVSYHEVLSTIIGADLGIGVGNILIDMPAVASAFWGLEPIANAIDIDSIPQIQSYDGNAAGNDAANIARGSLLQSTKGPTGLCIIEPNDINALQDVADENTGAMVYVDTNGWMNLPNKIGKDIFGFSLLNGGKLVPLENSRAGEFAERVIDAGFKVTY